MVEVKVKDLMQETFNLFLKKGPGDRLSEKQKVWIDALLACGINVEELYVQAS